MLRSDAQDRLTVVLVGARNPQNIGAAARAMQDFGFHDLRVVNEFSPPFETALAEATSAVGASEVMHAARRFSALEDAIADCHLVVGTTAIGGRNLHSPVLALREAASSMSLALANASVTRFEPACNSHTEQVRGRRRDSPHVALLFGSEKSGLTKEQLSYCSLLLTIPMFAPEGRHLSMNLGQSVAVCLYELTRDGFEGARALPVEQDAPAATADRERLLGLVLETMQRSDYARRFPANARVEVVRQLVNKLGTTRKEAATWMGLLRLILRRLPEALSRGDEDSSNQ